MIRDNDRRIQYVLLQLNEEKAEGRAPDAPEPQTAVEGSGESLAPPVTTVDVPTESTPADVPTTEAAQTEQGCSEPVQAVLLVPTPASPIMTVQLPAESEPAKPSPMKAAQVEEDRSELVQQAAVNQPSAQVLCVARPVSKICWLHR